MSFMKKQTAPAVDLSKPSLEGLIFLLRNKEFWPTGFTWDYREPEQCAIGLFECTYGSRTTSNLIIDLGISNDKAQTAFFHLDAYLGLKSMNSVNPTDVADYLERNDNE